MPYYSEIFHNVDYSDTATTEMTGDNFLRQIKYKDDITGRNLVNVNVVASMLVRNETNGVLGHDSAL